MPSRVANRPASQNATYTAQPTIHRTASHLSVTASRDTGVSIANLQAVLNAD